jgi:hypothetical protein
MRRFELTDDILKALFWIRGRELKCLGAYRAAQCRPKEGKLYFLCDAGAAKVFFPNHSKFGEAWALTREGRDLLNAVIDYEENNPRFSAEEGPSAVLHRGRLYQWSYSTALHEIENLRRMRQKHEERKAKRSGRTGCHATRYRAAPRPKVAICVDDCRHGKGV